MGALFGRHQRILAWSAWLIAVACPLAEALAEPGLVQSSLRSPSLEQVARDATTLRMQNVAGDECEVGSVAITAGAAHSAMLPARRQSPC